jgi:hypothetical protein
MTSTEPASQSGGGSSVIRLLGEVTLSQMWSLLKRRESASRQRSNSSLSERACRQAVAKALGSEASSEVEESISLKNIVIRALSSTLRGATILGVGTVTRPSRGDRS